MSDTDIEAVILHEAGEDEPQSSTPTQYQPEVAYVLTIYTNGNFPFHVASVQFRDVMNDFAGINALEIFKGTSDGRKCFQLKDEACTLTPQIPAQRVEGNVEGLTKYVLPLSTIPASFPKNTLSRYTMEIFWSKEANVRPDKLRKTFPTDSKGGQLILQGDEFTGSLALPVGTGSTTGTSLPTETPLPDGDSSLPPGMVGIGTTEGVPMPTQNTSTASPTETAIGSGKDKDGNDSKPAAPASASTGGGGGGLSTGAKAGVGVGAAVVVILILGLIFFVMRRRKRGRQVAGGYVTPTRSERELKEKEVAVGVLPHSTNGSTNNLGSVHEGGAVAPVGLARGGSYNRGDDRTGLGAPAVGRKQVGEDLENGRESRTSVPTTTALSDEERLRWEEEERRLDADIAEAERRRRAGE